MVKLLLIFILTLSLQAESIVIQILGSGGPEFSKRASSSYIIWVNGKARVLVDMGSGSFLRFTQAGAKIEDLHLVALTHLHIDHVNDLPAFMKGGFFSNRKQVLPLLGTTEGGDFPDLKTFLKRLFGKRGAFAYMSDILTPQSDSFMLEPIVLKQKLQHMKIGSISITSLGVSHGPVPAMAYAFEIGGKKIVFSGDTSADSESLIRLAKDADYLVAHHAIAEKSGRFARSLHMTPSRIGEVANKAGVKHLILSHRMTRTYKKESESKRLIRKRYKRKIIWAKDLMKIKL